MMKIICATVVATILVATSAAADAQTKPEDKRALLAAMHPRTGKIRIANDIVELNVGPHFKYLDNADATTMLTKIMGNPPDAVEGNLGMVLPTGDGETWFAVLSYSADGHVSDSDAASVNYDDLLKQMQEETDQSSKGRRNSGFAGLKLLGWAQRPYYDSNSKKIYWAKAIQFDSDPTQTLNYDVRVLGRTGFLNIKIVDSMQQLTKINSEMPQILTMANFTPSNTYADYVAGTDHTAAYGIAGLVAGGVLAKAGFFKGLLVLLAASWKLVAAAVVGFLALIAKFFKRMIGREEA